MSSSRPVPLSDAAVHHLARATDWPDLSGTRYTALEELGQGGMGTVFRARDALLDRDVALKVLRTADAPRDLAERLEREAGVLALLEHPGVVPVHDRGVLPDGRAWYVMKLVRGERLDAWLAKDPSLVERLDLLQRIAETLGFAHARGVVHRDLKPANIMVGEFGEVLVLDWGVANCTRRSGSDRSAAEATARSISPMNTPLRPYVEEPTTAHGTILGTAGFMSPEQERGRSPPHRPARRCLRPRCPAAGDGGALAPATRGDRRESNAPDREQRYGDASEFAADLRRFQDGDRSAPTERALRETGAGGLQVPYPDPAGPGVFAASHAFHHLLESEQSEVPRFKGLKGLKGLARSHGIGRIDRMRPRDLETLRPRDGPHERQTMKKPVFGMLLGGVLGIFDGLSALVSAPETAPGIMGIVIGSTIKGIIAGAAIGWFARKVNSLPLGILFGTAVGLLLAWMVSAMQKAAGQPPYYMEIMIPGAIVGLIVGYATQRHTEAARRTA